MIKHSLALCALIPSIALSAQNNINFVKFDTQTQFKEFAEDFTGGLSFKTTEPAEPLGITGFDIGISYDHSTLKNKRMSSVSLNPKDDFQAVTLHATKGLPLGIDVGLKYTTLPASNVSTWGAKLSYAIMDGGVLSPSIGISGNYSQTTGLDDISFKSYGADIGISKGFANITPFASAGLVMGEVTTESTNLGSAGSLDKEEVSLPKYAIGVNVNLLVMDITASYNQIGEVPTYSLKAGFRF